MSETQLPNQTILIVDDDQIIQRLLGALLADFGTVVMASTGDEAITKIAEQKPDLIILDVEMPSMNGYEVCRRLKADEATSDIPVIFLTASTSDKDEERGLEIGATDFIRKPISHKIVLARVWNILSLQAATRKLEILATTDSLTGAHNRRHFLEIGNTELRRSIRYSQVFSVAMLDIDHFKAVNDTYGHGVGDEALIKTVSVIQDVLRVEDILGRLGGEEFGVIFPMTAIEGATLVAERIREKIAEINIDTPLGDLRFTMSIGLSSFAGKGDTVEAALKRADQALYRAKEGGRNRVIAA